METLTNTTPKARKEHQCNFCGGIIEKGEVYQSQTNVYEGDIYTWKSHTTCQQIVRELNMFEEADDNGVCDGMFSEYINETYSNLTDTETGELMILPKTTFQERLSFVKQHYLKTS
ncbi:hypothetical protein PL373_13270 [Tenacibaculum maritimum]|nr:hypothetical protein [Tenacibaculum maritimum]MDB0600304.1 hypothetical protein [Tenacibaculum maritimum]MDB0602099.1 hypothetical protein [Tenacibaculum maritimum]MDB0610815.1 hypothetical protein [Tenacibaculum maritimum]